MSKLFDLLKELAKKNEAVSQLEVFADGTGSYSLLDKIERVINVPCEVDSEEQLITKLTELTASKGHLADYKVGDKVWDSWYKNWWTITEINLERDLPIRIERGKDFVKFINFAGQDNLSTKANPRFICQPFEIPPEAFERPEPKSEKFQDEEPNSVGCM